MYTNAIKCFVLTLVFGLGACHIPRASISNHESLNADYVMDVLVLYVQSSDDIFEWGEEAYDNILKGRFNDLANKRNREFLFKNFSRRLYPTFVHNYADYFSDHKIYEYDEFVNILDSANIKHILLVNLRITSLERSTIYTNTISPNKIYPNNIPITTSSISNAHQVYLLETKNPKPIWIAYGFPGPARNIARSVHRDLRKENFFYSVGDRASRN